MKQKCNNCKCEVDNILFLQTFDNKILCCKCGYEYALKIKSIERGEK